MTVVKWNPFGKSVMPTLFDKLNDDFFNLDNLFDSRLTSNINQAGSVNVAETERAYEIEVSVPGSEKNNFNVKIEGNQLSIIAEKKTESKTEDAEKKYLRREFGYTSFQRTFTLPENIDASKISATHNNGILVVTLPKVTAEEVNSNAKTIEIS